jgi:hypothetical protein
MQDSEGKQAAKPSAAALAASIVVDEQDRRDRDSQADAAIDYEVAPQGPMKLREGLRTGGFSVATVLMTRAVKVETTEDPKAKKKKK